MTDDVALAALARDLARALMDFAYTRKDEDRKKVNDLQANLCTAVRREEQDERPL